MNRNKLKHPFFVIIGPSGSGKTKVAEAVFPAAYKVISHTTRQIRDEEQDGIDYYFETNERFEYLSKTDALAEHDIYDGNQYGVGIAELLKKTSDHYAYDVLTIKGFQEIEKQFGSMVIPIFFKVSQKNVLTRLQTREENIEIINQRRKLYEQESENIEVVVRYANHYIIDADQSFDKVVKDVNEVVSKIIKKG